MRSTGSPYVDKGKLRTFFTKPLQKELQNAQLDQKLAKNMDRGGNRTLSIKGYLFKREQVKILRVIDASRHLKQPHTFLRLRPCLH